MKLVGVAEIAERFGVTKQVVTNWKTRRNSFPKPVVTLKSGPVWSWDALEKWANEEEITFSASVEDTVVDASENESTRRAIVVGMMNMKGGVGKSTLTANLGWFAAHQRDKRVLFIDLDPQFNLSQYILGARGYERLIDENSPTIEAIWNSKGADRPESFSDLVRKMHEWSDGSCLHIVPANLELAFTMRMIGERAHILRDYVDEMRGEYDLILIDCAPTESILSTAAYLASDYVFVPVRPEFLSTIGLPLLLRSMEEFKKNYKNEPVPEFGGIIFNDTGEKVEHDRSRAYVQQIASKHDLPVFENEVSHSDSYPAGSRVGQPIFLTDHARETKKKEFQKVALEFLGKIGL